MKGDVLIVDTSKISNYLRECRLKNNLTQSNVAENLGLTPQAVSKWERCESMPDITLLPEISKMYGVTVEDILSAGTTGADDDFTDIIQVLNTFVDDRIFTKVRLAFEKAKSVRELNIPMDFFMALNGQQKDILLELLLEMDDYGVVVDDILQYLNTSQRTRLIRHIAQKGDYEVLEILIPFMTKAVRTEVVTLLLERGNFDFLEEMLLFLNQEQRELVINYVTDNNREQLERLLPFFDRAGRKVV